MIPIVSYYEYTITGPVSLGTRGGGSGGYEGSVTGFLQSFIEVAILVKQADS